MSKVLRKAVFVTFRWILAAILFNAVAALANVLLLSAWYMMADGVLVRGLLAREFSSFFCRGMLGWLFVLLVYPPMQRRALMSFRALINAALRDNPTGAEEGTLRLDKA